MISKMLFLLFCWLIGLQRGLINWFILFLKMISLTFSHSSEEQFLFPLQSQIICESQSIRNPVNTLVCDCLDDGGLSTPTNSTKIEKKNL